jgi:hypothetical protein
LQQADEKIGYRRSDSGVQARLQKIETESTDPLRLHRLESTDPLRLPKEAALSLKGPNVADLMSQITKLEEVLLLACSGAYTNVNRKGPVVQTHIDMHILCMHSLVQIHKNKDLRLCAGR